MKRKTFIYSFIIACVTTVCFWNAETASAREAEEEDRSHLFQIQDKINQYSIQLNEGGEHTGARLTVEDVRFVHHCVKKYIEGESLLRQLSSREEEYLVVGDIHGDLTTLKTATDYAETMGKTCVLLGDVTDRGQDSFESVMYALIKQLLFPQLFVYIRGNHESLELNFAGGDNLKTELFAKGFYPGWELLQLIRSQRKEDACETQRLLNEAFNYLPLAAIIQTSMQKIFCVHGGIGPTTYPDTIARMSAPLTIKSDWDAQIVEDLLWSDPEPISSIPVSRFQIPPKRSPWIYGKSIMRNKKRASCRSKIQRTRVGGFLQSTQHRRNHSRTRA